MGVIKVQGSIKKDVDNCSTQERELNMAFDIGESASSSCVSFQPPGLPNHFISSSMKMFLHIKKLPLLVNLCTCVYRENGEKENSYVDVRHGTMILQSFQ